MAKDPNSDVVSDDDVKKVASNLGIDLDDDDNGTEENEFDSSEKTDTETTEKEGRGDNSEKDVDYKAKYAASTKEFQEKYKPLEDKVRQLEQTTGKSIAELLEGYTKPSEEQINANQKNETKKDNSSGDSEVNEKLSSVVEKLSTLENKVLEQEERNKLSAKERVDTFRGKYGISEDDYVRRYQPLLSGIKEMRKENGDPYTLDEALEAAYVFGNRDNIDKIVETKIRIRQKEQELSLSPQGERQTSSSKKPIYSEAQKEAASKLGTDLSEKEE